MDISILIEKCKNDESLAQHALYKLFFRRLYVVVMRYIPEEMAREEVLADGFVKIFKHIHMFSYQSDAKFYSWMKTIMVNESLMFLRKRKEVFYTLEDNTDTGTDDYNPLNTLNLKEIMEQIQHLPTGYRTVFNLYFFEDKTHREIAQLLGISEPTSKSQLHKARKLLQKQIQNT